MLAGGASHAVTRNALVAGPGRGAVRAVRSPAARRSLATETTTFASPASNVTQQAAHVPSPQPTRRFLPRLVLYSSALGVVFYGGSTVLALNSDRYHDFFVESVPFGETIIDHAEHNGWDRSLRSQGVQQAVYATKSTYGHLEGVVTRTFGSGPSSEPPSLPPTRAGQAAPPGSKVKQVAKEGKETARAAAKTVVEKVEKDTEKVQQIQKDVVQAVRKAEREFSPDVKELVDEVEAFLAGKTYVKPSQRNTALLDTQPTRGVVFRAIEAQEPPPGMKIYDRELPIEHQPPPGYILPGQLKSRPASGKEPNATSAPPVLPLVAPSISKLSSAEPVLGQLAQSIDNLAGFLRDNPTASSEGAKDVLQTAEMDLTQLGERLQKVKEEEHRKLEEKLDEQAKEYNLKLLEMEAEAQDKIDRQEEDWKSLFDEERGKILHQYREKLQRELETQQELINQRLKEEVIAQGIELQRRWIRDIKVRVEQERGGRLAKLDDLAADVKRLERVTADSSTYLDENVRLHSLWSALRAVSSAVEAPKRRPFREELRVLHNVAAIGDVAKNDPLVAKALESLESSTIPDVGVEPLSDLTLWFHTSVAPKVESVSLVPDQGAGLMSHVASSILSTLRFKPRGLVDGKDVSSVLARAEYHLNEKNLDSAARELNQLTGWPKLLLTDWLNAARARLEIEQALDVIHTEATLASLRLLETK